LRIGADSCMEAVNCRACRRCPYVPHEKLKRWAEELQQRKVQRISERQNLPALLTTPFNTVNQENKEKKSLSMSSSNSKSR
jgi:hypothetical protein